MLLDRFKQGKEVDFIKATEKYISKHFGKNKHIMIKMISSSKTSNLSSKILPLPGTLLLVLIL